MSADGEPCPECSAIERRVLIGTMVGGALVGFSVAFVIFKMAR